MPFKIIKKLVGIFGFKLVSKNLIKNDRLLNKSDILSIDAVLSNLINQNKLNTLIQIGANDGLRFDNINKFIKKYQLKSILVEPIREYFEQLKVNYQNYDNIFFENVAICVNDEISYLYTVDKKFHDLYGEHIKGINSFNINHLLNHGVKKKHLIKESVKNISIIDLFKKYDFKIDLLLIDAEGYDSLIVTDLLKNSNLRPIIIFEYIHTEFFDLDKLNILLYEKKYKLFTVQENLICIPKEIELKLLI